MTTLDFLDRGVGLYGDRVGIIADDEFLIYTRK